ncbi:hypothetical protein ACC809_36825, partial [Rhizobium johnstonii]
IEFFCLHQRIDLGDRLLVFVFFDLTWAHGEHALKLISVSNLAVLVIIGIAAAAASRSRAPAETMEEVLKSETTEDKETITTVDA